MGKTWRSDILRSDSLTDDGIPQILPSARLLSSVALCASDGDANIGCSAVVARFMMGTARLQAQFIRQRINSWSMGCSDASRERWRLCQWLQNSGVRPEYRWGHMQGITLLEFENRTLARATASLLGLRRYCWRRCGRWPAHFVSSKIAIAGCLSVQSTTSQASKSKCNHTWSTARSEGGKRTSMRISGLVHQ